MKRIYLFQILIVAFYLVQSCKSKIPKSEYSVFVEDSITVDTVASIIYVDTIDYLQLYIDSILIGKENSIIGEDILAEKALPEFYRKNNYQAFWIDSLKADEAIRQFEQFDFGTNLGQDFGIPEIQNVGQTSNPTFAGLTPMQIAQLLTGGNISNF